METLKISAKFDAKFDETLYIERKSKTHLGSRLEFYSDFAQILRGFYLDFFGFYQPHDARFSWAKSLQTEALLYCYT